MKTDAIIFGIGANYKRLYQKICAEYNIVAITDNDSSKWHTIDSLSGKEIIPPSEINKYNGGGDIKMLITPNSSYDIILQLINQHCIPLDIVLNSPCAGLNIFKCFVEGDAICYAVNGIKIYAQSQFQPLSSFFEIFICHEYKIEYSFCDNDKIIAIDIGMNCGMASLYFANMANVEKVYSYEPFEENYSDALSNFAFNPNISHKISPNHFGLGNKNEVLRVNKGIFCREITNEYASITIRDSAEVLYSVINDNYLKNIIWLKCDCEGGEYDIFESLDNADLLSKIHIITMEWHGGYEKLVFLKKILFKNNFAFYITDHVGIGMIYGFKVGTASAAGKKLRCNFKGGKL